MRTGSIMIPHLVNPEHTIAPIKVAKGHEDLANTMEDSLRAAFNRADLWVLPYTQLNRQHVTYPCLRVIDGGVLLGQLSDLDSPPIQKAKELYPIVYGQKDVYVSAEEINLTSLKYVVDHLLALRYGHTQYSVELFALDQNGNMLDEGESEIAELLVNSWEDALLEDDDPEDDAAYSYPIPNDVLVYITTILKEFRPDVTFKLAKEYTPVEEAAVFAPGFIPL